MKRSCTYLRVVATTRCNLQCRYCHAEGDPQRGDEAHALPFADLDAALDVASRLGIRKYKFLGGEPLLRGDLPDVVRSLRARAPDADLSVITAGVRPAAKLEALYDAGLTRANVSVHGFAPDKLAERIPAANAHAQREAFLAYAMSTGKPLKLNYVYSNVFAKKDLADLLAWAAGKPVTVGLLDDLNKDYSWRTLDKVLRDLRGPPARIERCEDPDSLDTALYVWDDGLRVELKDRQLGEVAPWKACDGCPKKAVCKEGIHALRLDHLGQLRPCMDRPDLTFPLVEAIRAHGVEAATGQARAWLEEV
ncbi:MAG: hypothetical protein RL199_596 [Pseudomonadota bacterium]|jgi:molybdenum cofactor biosynthesis enzyme MoaA